MERGHKGGHHKGGHHKGQGPDDSAGWLRSLFGMGGMGGMGGGGGMGDMGGMDGQCMMSPPYIQFFSNTCKANPSAPTPCVAGRSGHKVDGAWVCRTVHDVVTGKSTTFSACVDTDHFIKTDKCDCCDGKCPSIKPCGCACKIPGHSRRSGVLVKIVGSASDEGTRCVPPELSVDMVTGPGLYGRAVCVSKCT